MLQKTFQGVNVSLRVCGDVGEVGVYHLPLLLLDIFWFHPQMVTLS